MGSVDMVSGCSILQVQQAVPYGAAMQVNLIMQLHAGRQSLMVETLFFQ